MIQAIPSAAPAAAFVARLSIIEIVAPIKQHSPKAYMVPR